MALYIDPTAVIHPTAVIGPNVSIGASCRVGAFTVIGTHAEHKSINEGEKVTGCVEIGSGTIIREHVTIHASVDLVKPTSIGAECYIQAHAHIGHDAQIGYKVTVACFACVGGASMVGDHANLGLHSVLHQRAIVGEGVMLGANAFGKGFLNAWMIYVGTPAKAIGMNHRLLHKMKGEL